MKGKVQVSNLNSLTFYLQNRQAGFRKDMDTPLNIHILDRIINSSNTYNRRLHVTFRDLSKAYDSLQHWAIRENMEFIGFDEGYSFN